MTVTFDRVLNVVLITVVLYFGIAAMRPASAPKRTAYERGETAPAIAGVSYAGAPRTVVLFVRSTCHFCTESMPFYQSLQQGGARLVAISSEPKGQLDAYLIEHGLPIESAILDRNVWAKLSGTPTMIIVDNTGRIVGSWMGLLPDNDQQQVRDLLEKGRVS